MTHYEIHIHYTTGDSFNTEEIYGESIGIVTTDIDKAKENLKRIAENHNSYINDVSGKYDFKLSLLTDDGERQVTPFWIGYFETLHKAEIVTIGDDSMKFEP